MNPNHLKLRTKLQEIKKLINKKDSLTNKIQEIGGIVHEIELCQTELNFLIEQKKITGELIVAYKQLIDYEHVFELMGKEKPDKSVEENKPLRTTDEIFQRIKNC